MSRLILLGGFSLLLTYGFANAAAFQITEFMALNRETLNDEEGDSSDWIEIHNPDSIPQSLEGWFLSDDPENLTRWRFPAGVWLSANEYLVVFASGKDKTTVPGRLHTNFRLAQSGEFLALLDPQTNIVSQFSWGFLAQDVSYGRDRVDPSITGYFARATPGAPNTINGPGFAPEVQFSRASGTFVTNAPFLLQLSVPPGSGVIRYELGTNAPGIASRVYSSPILITNTTLVRARAFQDGLLPGPISERIFFGLANATNVTRFHSHLPVIVLHNYGEGPLPGFSEASRTLLMQVFDPDAGQLFLTDAPAQVERGTFHRRGDATLEYQKGSFTIEIRDEFDEDKDVGMLGMPPESDWLLIAPNNFEPGIINNPLAYQLARDLGQYAPRTRLVEVYLKEESGPPGAITSSNYSGIYVLTEKIKRNPNRVDIDKLEPEHVNEPQISGGYMLIIDRSTPGEPDLNAGGMTMQWVEPPRAVEMANPSRAPQVAYITDYFNAMRAAINSPDYTNAVPSWAAYLDADSWITRHIHEVLTFNIDALRLSTFLYKPRNGRINFGPAYDYDRTQGGSMSDDRSFNPRTWRSRTGDLGTDFFNPINNGVQWWSRLFTAPDFWQRWIDRYQELRDGPLSMANITNHIQRFASEVRPAHAREVARWNIQPRSGTLTMGGGFTHNFGTNGYENEVRWYGVWYSNRLDFMDTNFLDRPSVNVTPGMVANGIIVTLSPAPKQGSWVYYTLDGTDPRLSGGGISPTAFGSLGPVQLVISSNVHLVARSWNPAHRNLIGQNNPQISSPWSGVRDATYYTALPPLRITELMYHPQDALTAYTNDVNFEYIEVKNIGATPLNLTGFTLGGGVVFNFPNITLNAGQAGVIVANQDQFIARYGPGKLIIGQYAGDFYGSKTNVLDDAGERLILLGPAREPILDFEYDDAWYPITDGLGFSLVVVNEYAPTWKWRLKRQWRPSSVVDGSPAADDPPPAPIVPIVINEVLTHSDPAHPYDSIELHNPSGNVADIGGWFLTDDFQTPRKYRIPDETTIPPGGYLVLDETQFNAVGGFSLSSLGEEVFLFSADPVTEDLTGYTHGFTFGPAENGRTFGRYITSQGAEEYPPQAAATLGGPNAGPLIGPIIISEIHYRPPDRNVDGRLIDNTLDEYIELSNTSSTNAPLYHPQHPTNTWHLENAVSYVFPPSVELAGGSALLVVSFDPANAAQLADFRARNLVPENVPVFGPYAGKLDNSGATLELQRPDRPEPPGFPNFGVVPYVLVERVSYSDSAPWSSAADGFGPSLQRISETAYGNDPANWIAAASSPGGPYAGGTVPEITTQPADIAVYYSYNATFSVQAQGSGLRYQWFFNDATLPNATNATVLIPYAELPNAGQYRVVVLGSGGAIASRNALLSVLTNSAVIISQPVDTAVVLTNSTTLRTTISSSQPVAYQWFFNSDAIPGANATTYTIPSARLEHAGVYQLRITDSMASIWTREARLTVLVQPWFVHQPQSMYVPFGSSATVSVEVTNNATLPITYRWRTIGGGRYTNENSLSVRDFFTVSNVTISNSYDVIVFNRAYTNGLQSKPFFFIAPIPDTDGDGMPDSFEMQYGFDINSAADAAGDLDGDGMTNLAEYIAGTDPSDNTSYLSVTLVDASARLRFMAVSNKTYSVQFRNTLGPGPWGALRHVTAVPTNRTVEVIDSSPDAASRFYRLATPKQ